MKTIVLAAAVAAFAGAAFAQCSGYSPKSAQTPIVETPTVGS
ncbi:hypothetical protein [Rubrimonas cliftonensis]|uniref:Lipoprotein-attachment site-containing protein n=1 Tax=Rubrimonas cliftonensis TaxID=89524 RepID=A0A1H4DVI5_9RHOB|nr:hypothetical protein [Rubrimonas cliftonensis]SEA76783.1 hypothetical protein SAMN05444370_11168 [Rubrimonas cliftonensis]